MNLEQSRARWVAAQGLDGRAAPAGGLGVAAAATAATAGRAADEVADQTAAHRAERSAQVAAAARQAAGLQAQAAAPTRLAVRARTAGLTAADVDAACADRAVVRTWLMRGTIHLVPAGDLRARIAVFGPVNVHDDRRRRGQLGLTDELCERALAALAEILPGRALTRAEIVAGLAEHGIALDLKSQGPPHLLAYAAGRALICRGPDATRDEPTYTVLDEWLGPAPAPDRDQALAELAAAYFAAYAPADAADFKAWSGLPAADVRRALDQVAPPAGDDGTELPERTHTLLGAFDPYLLGHATREAILDPVHARRLNAGGGMIAPVMLRAGRVVGTWKLDRSRKEPRFAYEPFEPGEDVAPFQAEADDIVRFLGVGA